MAVIKLAPDGSLEVNDPNASAADLEKLAKRLWNHMRRYPQSPRQLGMGFTLPDGGRRPTPTMPATSPGGKWQGWPTRPMPPVRAETGLASCDVTPPVPTHSDPTLPPPDFDG